MVLMLSQSLDDLGITLGECLGRTRWSSLLDLTTYLYYFTSGCVPIITQSHVLPEHSMITWHCHIIWLPNLPCYLYLDPLYDLMLDQMFWVHRKLLPLWGSHNTSCYSHHMSTSLYVVTVTVTPVWHNLWHDQCVTNIWPISCFVTLWLSHMMPSHALSL